MKRKQMPWACRFHPTNWFHEVGCPHKEWTKEELQKVVNTKKISDQLGFDEQVRLHKIITELKENQRPLYEIPCSDGNHNSFWKTVVESSEWKLWEKEVHHRFHEHTIANSKVYTGCFDVDECRECGFISPEHFISFMEWIKNQAICIVTSGGE